MTPVNKSEELGVSHSVKNSMRLCVNVAKCMNEVLVGHLRAKFLPNTFATHSEKNIQH